MFKLIGTHLKPYWLLTLLTVALTVVQVVSNLMLPNIMSSMVNEGVLAGDLGRIFSQGWAMLAWTLVGAAAVLACDYGSSVASMSVGRDLRREVFAKTLSLSEMDFDEVGTSSLITRTTSDVTQIERMTATLLFTALTAPVTLVGALVMMLLRASSLALAVVAGVVVVVGVVATILRRGIPLLRDLRVRIDDLNQVTREGLVGVRVIRAYAKEAYEERRFSQVNAELQDATVRTNRLMALMMPSITFVVNLVIVAVMWLGAPLVGTGGFMVGDLMAVVEYASMVLSAITSLSLLFSITMRAIASAERITEVLSRKPSVADPADPVALGDDEPVTLALNQVSYTFPQAEKPALEGIDLVLEPGTTTALIGSTGCGKSTLAKLLLRFADPTAGSITANGIDLRRLSQADLRRRVASVPQSTLLFSGTIADNIRYGRPEATDEEVRRAARIAQADQFIEALPEGYGAAVAQGGRNLSGGQRQRLAIARALICRASVYVFDDSSSALDFATEARLRQALARELPNAAVLVIAQRISVAMDADRVVVLDEGRVVGAGTHEELLETCSVYRQIAASQLADEDLAAAGLSVSEGGGPHAANGR